MKNLLKKYTGILSLLSFLLMLPIHYAYSQNVDELFGINKYLFFGLVAVTIVGLGILVKKKLIDK